MANTYKNIVITPNISSNADDPKIVFSGANTTVNTDITLRVYPDSNGALSFEGSAGQLFSVTNDLSNNIFGVNDVSGIPSLEIFANGVVSVVPISGSVGIGTTSPTEKLHVVGNIKTTGYMDSDLAFRGQANDTASIPSFTWTGETNTGIYRPSTNVIGFSIGGSETARFDSSGLTIPKSGAVINLTNATSGYINYAASGYAAPTVTTRSAGTKLVLYPGISSTAVDWAIGIESATMWFSASALTSGFKWYANTTNFMSATSTQLNHTGSINAASHTVGTSTIANATGVYTGIVNAASHTVGTSTIANSTGVYTGTVNATTITGGSNNINGFGVSGFTNSQYGIFGAASGSGYGVYGYNGSTGYALRGDATSGYGLWAQSSSGYGAYIYSATGHPLYVGNSSINFLRVWANGNVTLSNTLYLGGAISSGINLSANTTGVYHTGTMNAASHTVGTSTIANATGVYTGIINAASHTVGTAFTANATMTNTVLLAVNTSVSVGNATINAVINSTSIYFNSSAAGAASIVKPSANGSTFVVPIGSNVASNPFWNGWHFTPAAPTFTNATSVINYPRVSHYYTYTSTANPSDLYYTIQTGNDGGIGQGIRIYSLSTAGVTGGIDIAANGNIGIANTTPAEKLVVTGNISTTGVLRHTTTPFIEMVKNVASNYTISTNYNAMSAGPITINTGVTVTIPTGSTWTVV